MASERKIGSNVYRCEQLPADQGLGLLLRVSEMFSAAPAMLDSITKGEDDREGVAALMVLALSGGMDHDKCQAILRELVETCRVSGDPCVVGVKPQSLKETVAVAWFAMKVQFRDFLSEGLS